MLIKLSSITKKMAIYDKSGHKTEKIVKFIAALKMKITKIFEEIC